MAKTLVAYFSASGRTRKKAEKLAKELGADLYEIRPAVPYTKKDLNWMDDPDKRIGAVAHLYEVSLADTMIAR